MKDKDGSGEVYGELLGLRFVEPRTGGVSRHERGACDDGLVIDYVSGVLSDSAKAAAEEKIFACSKCTLLAIDSLSMHKVIPEVQGKGEQLDVDGFNAWRARFEKKHSYTVTKRVGAHDLKFTVKGWTARVSGIAAGSVVKIGSKSYGPRNMAIEYPDTPEACLELPGGKRINIHELIGCK